MPLCWFWKNGLSVQKFPSSLEVMLITWPLMFWNTISAPASGGAGLPAVVDGAGHGPDLVAATAAGGVADAAVLDGMVDPLAGAVAFAGQVAGRHRLPFPAVNAEACGITDGGRGQHISDGLKLLGAQR